MQENKPMICLECGASLEESQPTCLHLFEKTIVELSNQPHWRGEMRMAMDAYALQHLEQFCPHRRSVAVHLMGLCWGMEWNGDAKVARAMQRWLEDHHDLPELPPPFISPFDEVMSVRDALIHLGHQDDMFVQTVRQWGQSVWQQWHEHHRLVRQWISNAVNRQQSE